MNDEDRTRDDRTTSRGLLVQRSAFIVFFTAYLGAATAGAAGAQLETIEGGSTETPLWISQGQAEGHLALSYSPAAAFSPDNATIAVIADDKIVLTDLNGGTPRVLRPRVKGIRDLAIHSASFLTPQRILVLGHGVIPGEGKAPPRATPTLGFLWDTEKDVLNGIVNTLGEKGGYGTPRFFPMIGYVGLYKESNFDLWHPLTGKAGRVTIPALTRQPNLYEFSPNGLWLILAQLEGSSGGDPIVVDLRKLAFVDTLAGQNSTTLSIAFSRDNRRVVTACEDGKLRLWSVGDWKLVATLPGHSGTVAWAEFSPDGRWIVSGGYDKTVRVWAASDGRLQQTLTEPRESVRTVAFSPRGDFIAATSEERVWFWKLSHP
jgi:WD40 repeat protein